MLQLYEQMSFVYTPKLLTSSFAHKDRFEKYQNTEKRHHSSGAWNYTLHVTNILIARETLFAIK